MITSRRTFLSMGASAALAGMLSSIASASPARTVALSFNETEQALLNFIAQYGARARFAGTGLLEKLRFGSAHSLHVLIEVDAWGKFEAALANFPFPEAYAEGNQISFSAGGTEFTLENLPARTFDERRMKLAKARYIAFAHDALSYDPATGKLVDPFGAARSSALRPVNRTQGSLTGLEVILRGLLEAEQLGLQIGPDFERWKTRLLRLIAKPRDAQSIATGFLRQLATVADLLPPEQIIGLLRTRTVQSALTQAFGLDVESVILTYQTLRALHPGSVSHGAIWLSLLLKAQLLEESTTGVLTPLLQSGPRFQVLRSRTALAQARQILPT